MHERMRGCVESSDPGRGFVVLFIIVLVSFHYYNKANVMETRSVSCRVHLNSELCGYPSIDADW